MALVFADRVTDTSITAGTLDFVLLGTPPGGFQAWSVIGNTNTAYYTATDGSGNWETGIGTYSSTGPTLARTTVLASSNSNAKVSFPAGTKTVFNDPASAYFVIYAAGIGAWLASPTSANLATAMTDETGTGALVFAGSPALTGSPTVPTQTAADNSTKAASTAYVTAAIAAIPAGLTGQWTHIGTLTASNNSTLSQALGATYSQILILVEDEEPASSSTLRVAVSSDGGSTFGTAMVLNSIVTASHFISGAMMLLNTGIVATKFTLPVGFGLLSATTAGGALTVTSAGMVTGSDAVKTGVTTNIRFSHSTGNLFAGVIDLWGSQ